MNKKMVMSLILGCSIVLSGIASHGYAEKQNSIQHVLLISVDGMHSVDIENYIKNYPESNIASLSAHGINYTRASCGKPSDSFPGMLAIVTGGTPNSTGVFYDDSYDRKLLPPNSTQNSNHEGTEVLFDESIDKNVNAIDGGGGINEAALPINPQTYQPVYPHDFVKVNNVFSVLKAAGKHTAWSDKHLSYDLLTGPSGKDIDDLYTPEIAAEGDATKSIAATEANDELKVKAVLNEILGMDHTGKNITGVPALFGMNFQSVSVAQKLPENGYIDAAGTPSVGLENALNYTDKALGQMIAALKKENLYNSTVIIITAKHGQSPIDPTKLKIINKKFIVDGIPDQYIAHMTTDDIALIWLTDQTKTNEVVSKIEANKEKAQIKNVYSFIKNKSEWNYNDPTTDSRVPDIIVQPENGVIYTKPGKKIAEHGGFSTDDTNVALLISSAKISELHINDTSVATRQIAPSILKLLGLKPNDLQAVRKEKTAVLPDVVKLIK